MNKLGLSVVAAIAALGVAGGASAAGVLGADSDAPAAKLVVGVYNTADPVGLEKTQWLFGGRGYCWYLDGWHGPGYYWCGYAYRRGLGWGGPSGWNGWGGGWRTGWNGAGWRPGYRGPNFVGDRPGFAPRTPRTPRAPRAARAPLAPGGHYAPRAPRTPREAREPRA